MSLRTHLLTAGICARVYLHAPSSRVVLSYLCEKWDTTPDGAISRVSYLCAVHDIGKAHPSFQQKDPEWAGRIGAAGAELELNRELFREKFRHEYYGAKVMKRIWKRKGLPSRGNTMM